MWLPVTGSAGSRSLRVILSPHDALGYARDVGTDGDRERPVSKRSPWLVVPAVVLVAVIVAAVVTGVVARRSDERRSADEARTACEDAVRDELQLRTSASFTDGPADGESFSFWGEFYSWTITGTVVAQTDDGSEPLRAAWTCGASLIDTDWEVSVSLS